MSKMILIAASTLVGGVLSKGALVPFEVAAGEELTSEKAAKLGLSGADVERLLETGALAETPVREAEAAVGGDTAALEALLADETKRADDAEAKVKDLESKLAAATKPAASAAQ